MTNISPSIFLLNSPSPAYLLSDINLNLMILFADVNECSTNNGGCEQTCENRLGDYTCECTNAGFVKDLDDFKKCVGE